MTFRVHHISHQVTSIIDQ